MIVNEKMARALNEIRYKIEKEPHLVTLEEISFFRNYMARYPSKKDYYEKQVEKYEAMLREGKVDLIPKPWLRELEKRSLEREGKLYRL